MSNLNIRTRLTITIVLLTGVVSAVGVLFGVRVLEGQVREAAIDERASQFEEFSELNFFSNGFGFDGIPGAEIIDEFGNIISIGGDFQIDPTAIDYENEQVIVLARSMVSELPSFANVVDEIGTDNDELLIWFGTGDVVAVTETSARLVPMDEIGGEPILPINDLFEIGLFPFEFGDFDNELFGGPESEDLILEVAQRTIADVPVGFIAEVGDELDALDAIRNTLRNVVIALTVLAGLTTWFIAGRALRPVGAITEQVQEITSGTLSERVPEPKSTDEVGVLARTMNSMLSRLETSDLRRRQFVSDASHELRTPVAVLRSEAEVARRAPNSTTIDDFATVVLGESKRLEGLVEDLLSLARGDESRTVVPTDAIDVDEIVLEEAARTRALPIDKSGVSAGRVIGHEDQMRRIIAHLLDNAARHGSSTVAVGVQTEDKFVHVWVDDDGPGIPEPDRGRVFERFIRLDDARTRDAGGAGLGLAVVQESVTRLSGTIEVVDSPLGGARFQIQLPAC